MDFRFAFLSFIMILVSLIWKPEAEIAEKNELDIMENLLLTRTSKSYNRISLVLIGLVVFLYIVFF